MKKYKVTATKDVGYQAIILAKDGTHAWQIAKNDLPPVNGEEIHWEKTDDGHDWTLESVSEYDEEKKDDV